LKHEAVPYVAGTHSGLSEPQSTLAVFAAGGHEAMAARRPHLDTNILAPTSAMEQAKKAHMMTRKNEHAACEDCGWHGPRRKLVAGTS
jgi:hypothetical protein